MLMEPRPARHRSSVRNSCSPYSFIGRIHRHFSQMQPAQHRKRCFTVQLTNVPIVTFEDYLGRKEDAVQKFAVDLLSKVCQLFDRVGAEG